MLDKLNDLRMPLYALMLIDGNGESVVVGPWIVAKEERATISGLMDIFIRNNDTESIKCVMADKDMVECDVMSEKLPDAALQICLFHTGSIKCHGRQGYGRRGCDEREASWCSATDLPVSHRQHQVSWLTRIW